MNPVCVHQLPSKEKGFTLLEVLLALAVFTIVAVSLTVAMNQIGLLAMDSALRARQLELVNSYLTEASKGMELEEGVREIKLPDTEFIIQIEIEPVELQNQDGELLEGMYRVAVRALKDVPGGERDVVEEAETYRYQALYTR